MRMQIPDQLVQMTGSCEETPTKNISTAWTSAGFAGSGSAEPNCSAMKPAKALASALWKLKCSPSHISPANWQCICTMWQCVNCNDVHASMYMYKRFHKSGLNLSRGSWIVEDCWIGETDATKPQRFWKGLKSYRIFSIKQLRWILLL